MLRLVTTCGGIALFATACMNDGENAKIEECGHEYVPFSADNYANQVARVGAYEDIKALRKTDTFSAADFDTIEALYNTADLSAKVEGRGDDHSYALDTSIGATMHATITTAIAEGKAGNEIAYQGQVIDKTLQHFFYLSVYHEGFAVRSDETRADMELHWDEAFGYLGIGTDATDNKGLAGTVAGADSGFGTEYLDEALHGLIEGRCAIANDDPEGTIEALEELDMALLSGLALTAIHELDEWPEDPLIKGIEAQIFWNSIASYVNSVDPDGYDVVEAQFEKGVENIDTAVIREIIVAAFDFDV